MKYILFSFKMFPSSTQLKFWTFSGTSELTKLRSEANHKFIKFHASEVRPGEVFLTASEEMCLCLHYEYELKAFCGRFQPPMPHLVVGTALSFFKRFYLHNSLMDYHPKYIIYTCVYLACKVEEFNVSITQFVCNMSGDGELAADTLLQQELLLMEQLHYHLTVHNPFRPLEGLLIDIKTRCPEVEDAEKLRKGAEDFLDRSLSTDVSLLFAPSQIALAAVLSSAGKLGINLDSYVTTILLATDKKEALAKTIEHIKRIRYLVRSVALLQREQVERLQQQLDLCQNPVNDPLSGQYRRRLEDWEAEEEEESNARKRPRYSEDEEIEDLALP